jgi:DsbC/DsbD-like thiol-disulfide interchange protein
VRQMSAPCMPRIPAVLAVCAGLFLCFASRARAVPESHATIEMIAAQVAPPQSGRPFSVGLLFHLEPGWHVYWQNAGDSGQPPTIQWSLPPGFRAGAIAWPTPTRLGKGSVIDYGYESQVLLIAPIHPPASRKSGQTDGVEIAADIKYLICREICVPAKAHATVSLPLSGDAAKQATQWRTLFERTESQIPKRLPSDWKVVARSNAENFVLSVRTAAPATRASFFPLDQNVIENSAPQSFAPAKTGFQLTLKKSDLLAKPITALRGVLVLDGSPAYEIAAPVIQQ